MTEQEAEKWAVENLSEFFIPSSIPSVIRRPAPLFNSETALAWIMRGKTEEVKAGYDKALRWME